MEKMLDRRPKTIPILLFVISLFLAPLLQAAADKAPLTVPKFLKAPKIDGLLDNPIWTVQALKVENFLQLSPKENGTPSQKTVAYLGYDHKNLYIAVRCEDTDVAKLRASVTNRDNNMDDDWVIVFLDTFNEKRRAFTFILSPAGVQSDAIRVEEGGNDNMDLSWDAVWTSEARVDAKGYTVEMAIPFKSLRFQDREEKVWGLTIGRNLPRNGEIIIWPEYSRSVPGLLSQSAQILVRGDVEKGGNLEVMPVATSLKREGKAFDIQPGANIKYGVNSAFTLDFALNPDFSQIEADAPQIDVNLRYALRYPEKRPFFLEGMEIFKYPEIEMVYTRRIVDPLLGAKASGKIGRFTYGVLSALDSSPSESLWDVHTGGSGDSRKALFNIVRLKTDVFSQSYIGFSLADRELGGSWNRVAGFDGQLRFNDKFFFSFQALASKTRGDARESGFAPALYGEFYYFNKSWSAGAFWKSIHPDFEASSGFVNRTDYRSFGGYAGFNLYPDKKFLNQLNFRLQAGERLGYFDTAAQDKWLRGNVRFRFTEFNQLDVTVENYMERYEGVDYRGLRVFGEAQSNIISWMPFGFFFQVGDAINYDPADHFLGWNAEEGVSLTFKPSKRLQLGVDYSKSTYWDRWAGKQLWDYNVVRAKVQYQVSRTLSVRTIVDYNHFYKELYGSFLVSWVLQPGTVFFLGLDTNYAREGDYGFTRYDRKNFNVFVKFSYWWRV